MYKYREFMFDFLTQRYAKPYAKVRIFLRESSQKLTQKHAGVTRKFACGGKSAQV